MALKKPSLSTSELRERAAKAAPTKEGKSAPEASTPLRPTPTKNVQEPTASPAPAPVKPTQRTAARTTEAVTGAKRAQVKPKVPADASGGEKIRFTIAARRPVVGSSKFYDRVVDAYGERSAALKLLKRAIVRLVERVSEGADPASLAAPYERSNDVIETTGRMEPATFEALRVHFDPLGMESQRKIAAQIAELAIGAYLAEEDGR